MENAVQDISKIQRKKVDDSLLDIRIPIIRRARTKNLAFLFNTAARILNANHELVICISFTSNVYCLSLNEVLTLKKLYGEWLLAYTKGYTNEKPTFTEFSKRTGYSMQQISQALNNKPFKGYTLTYELLKQWGYINEQ